MSSNSSSLSALYRRWFGFIKSLVAVTAISSWALASVFGIGSFLAASVLYGGIGQVGIDVDETSALFQMVFSSSVYLIGAAVLLVEPYAIRRMTIQQIQKLVGLARRPILKDVGLGLLAWGAYMILTTAAVTAVKAYIPMINLDQEQNIGFQTLANGMDIFYAFLVIVVAAPIVEELVFRGYLYGSLRPRLPRWIAAVIVSVLFGMVHWQLNVAIDTFVLSMVVCYMRDKTGAIWSGIVVHAVKNGLAFWLLFLAPQWIRQLLMGL